MIRPQTRGFTLIELMVALLIFGMLASAGVTLLSYTTRAQQIAGDKDEGTAAIRNLSVILNQDFAQALPYQSQPSTNGRAPEALLSYVRGGGKTRPEKGQGPLNQITWALEDDVLVRRVYRGAEAKGESITVPMMRDVKSVSLRFRSKGAWQSEWRPIDPAELPSAIEMTIATSKDQPVTIMAMAGQGQ